MAEWALQEDDAKFPHKYGLYGDGRWHWKATEDVDHDAVLAVMWAAKAMLNYDDTDGYAEVIIDETRAADQPDCRVKVSIEMFSKPA